MVVCHASHDVILERFHFTAKLSSPVYALKSAGDYNTVVSCSHNSVLYNSTIVSWPLILALALSPGFSALTFVS